MELKKKKSILKLLDDESDLRRISTFLERMDGRWGSNELLIIPFIQRTMRLGIKLVINDGLWRFSPYKANAIEV